MMALSTRVSVITISIQFMQIFHFTILFLATQLFALLMNKMVVFSGSFRISTTLCCDTFVKILDY